MDVRLGYIVKKKNSTLMPEITDTNFPFNLDCTLKDSCDVLNPVLYLVFASNVTAATQFNYAYIPLFGRYYFVTNVVFERNRVALYLNVDVLASHKQQILATTQYVLRSASNANNAIVDTTRISTANSTYSRMPINRDYATSLADGRYVVGIIGNNTSSVGAVSYYVMTQTQFNYFKSVLMTDYSYMGVGTNEISAELLKAIVNPFQYVVSCKWYPIEPPTAGTTTVKVSGWSLAGTQAFLLSGSPLKALTNTITLPLHPSGLKWAQSEPYSSYSLKLSPWGTYNIPANAVSNISTTLTVTRIIDFSSGIGYIQGLLTSGGATQLRVFEDSCQFGVDIPLAQTGIGQTIASTVTSVASGAGQMLGSALSGNVAGVLDGLTNTVSGVGSTIMQGVGSCFSSGATGALSQFNPQSFAFAKFVTVTAGDNDRRGTPLCTNIALSELSGYTLCANPSISLSGTVTETDAIKNYMASGFFIE